MAKTNPRFAIKGFMALLCCLAALNSCGEIDRPGAKVNFSASILGTETATRTVYGTDGSGFQYIDWSGGDVIRICCAQCDGDTYADYSATHNSHTSTGDKATISSSTGLMWGTGEHTFYAVYPSPSSNPNVSLTSSGMLTASIPSNQPVASITGSPNKVANPNMLYQYMVAKTTVAAYASAVNIEMLPLTTAIEFTIKNGFASENSMNVSYVKLSSDNYDLSGQFGATLGSTGVNNRPTCAVLLSGGSVFKTATINFSSPVSIAYGNTLKFTFFLNPGNGGSTGIDDITFEICFTSGSSGTSIVRKAKLEKSGVGCAFPTHKKTRVTGLMIPEAVEWDIEGDVFVTDWATGINQNVTLEL